MKARCHRCGQEYLAARNLAGKTVRCWTCGAANDGAGGAARDGVDGGEEPVDRGSTEAGSGQVVVEANPGVPIQAAPFVSPGPRPRPDLFRRLNRILIAVSGGLLFLATLGAFSIWFLSRPRAGSDGDWEPVQRAVPHIVSVAGSGSGFVTEIQGRLWLVTSYGIIDGVGSVKAIFDDPGSGAPGFSIEVSTESALVHEGFAGTPGEAGAWDVTALDIERWRPQFDGVGITPLAIDEGEGLRAGAPVVALGHSDGVPGPGAGTSGEFGTGVHSLVKGVVSTVRADGGRHRRLGTDARIGPGYRGGPLVLESSAKVVGVNGAQAAATSEDFGGLFPAVAADSVRELVDRGVPLSVIRGRISAASTSPLPGGVEHPETAWSRFNVLEERWERCRAQGWEWVDSIIRVTGDDGKDRVVHAVEGQGTRQVAVLAFPESPLVDLDIERFGPVGGPATGERRLAPGMPTLVEARDPLSGDRSGSTGGTDITMEISARFLGTPIRARYVVVLIQRHLGTSPSAPPAVPLPLPPLPPAPSAPAPEPPAPAAAVPVSHRSGDETRQGDFLSHLQGS